MPQKCAVPNCSSSYKVGKTLLSFPTNPERREVWLSALGLNGFMLKPHQRICEYHFKPSDWHDSVSKKKLLKQSAVPSLVCLNQHCLPDCEISSPKEGIVVLTPAQQMYHSSSCAISIAEDLKTATPVSTPRLLKKIKKCDQLSSENANLRNTVSKLIGEISCKTKDLQKTERRILALNQSANQSEEWLRSKFGDDQLKAAQTGNSKGVKWETESVQKALELRLAGGSAGLKAASDLVFPLPSVRTIQRRTQTIKFNPGLLHEFLEPLAEKVKTSFSTGDKDCALHFDEMSTKSQRSFDPGTGQYFGEVTLEGVEGLSCKLEVWTFAGLQRKWKMNAAYHCTPAEGCYKARAQVILDLLKFSEEAGLNCLALVCDMGNRGVLSTLGFNFTKNERKYAITHPFNAGKTLYVVPDVVHVFKAVKEMLVSNKIAYLSEDIVKRFTLPTNEIKFQHIEWIADFQNDMDVKFVPRLTKKDLSQNHFSKMNTATATHIFNDKCAATLNFLAEEKMFEEECKTTAWFVDLIQKWFTILTSRSLVHALSFKNMDVYKAAIYTLNLVVEVFSTLNVNNVWKPVQTHVIMATEALLDIQHHLIFELGYDFVFMSRFDNDVSENIYSDIRKQRPNPTPLESKYRLKQNTLSQCSRKVLKSQYNHDDRVNLLSLEDILEYQNKKKSVINQLDIVSVNSKPLPWEFPSQTDWKGYKFQHLILYRMCGYLLHSMRVNNQLKCDTCYNNLQHHGDSPLLVAKWVTQTDFAEGAQVQVSSALFDLLHAIDFNLKKWHQQLATAPNAKSLVEESIKPGLAKYEVPTCVACPNLKQRISNRFIVMRMKQSEQSKVATDKPQNEGYQLSSKSMGYRYLASRYTSDKSKGNAGGSKGGKDAKKKTPSTGIKRLKKLP